MGQFEGVIKRQPSLRRALGRRYYRRRGDHNPSHEALFDGRKLGFRNDGQSCDAGKVFTVVGDEGASVAYGCGSDPSILHRDRFAQLLAVSANSCPLFAKVEIVGHNDVTAQFLLKPGQPLLAPVAYISPLVELGHGHERDSQRLTQQMLTIRLSASVAFVR